MRMRHASIAVSTSSGARSTSELTGFGELMTTSCAPTARRDTNRSGMPRPERIGSSAAAASLSPCWRGVTPSSAGYRFGTTRTFQPGVSGAPLSGRSAHTSGGVWSSLPSANGSVSGSIGGRTSIFELNAPGRDARSPAMIARRPVSGSRRSSGNWLLHRHVGDALVEELVAPDLEAAALVERPRRALRVQADGLGAGPARLVLSLLEHRGADPAPAQVGLDGHAAEARDARVEDEPARAGQASVGERDDVQRLAIAAVLIGGERHPLLITEDAVAEVQGGLDLGGAVRGSHLDHSA